MRLLLLIPLMSIACATSGHKDPATLALPDGGALGADSESARVILLNNCGACHLGTLPGAKPAAVAIFDLTEAGDWSRKLNAEQWKIAISRLSASDREEKLFGEFARPKLQH